MQVGQLRRYILVRRGKATLKLSYRGKISQCAQILSKYYKGFRTRQIRVIEIRLHVHKYNIRTARNWICERSQNETKLRYISFSSERNNVPFQLELQLKRSNSFAGRIWYRKSSFNDESLAHWKMLNLYNYRCTSDISVRWNSGRCWTCRVKFSNKFSNENSCKE